MKFQWHVSALNMISKCGVQFERRYILGHKIPPGMGAITGTAVDKSVTANLISKKDTGKLLHLDEVQDIARETISSEWEKGVNEDKDLLTLGSTAAKAKAIDDAVTLSALHAQKHAPKLNPTHVQRPWVLDVKAMDVQIAGTIDIQEPGIVRDTKTSKRAPSGNEADLSLQLTTYALAVQVHDGAAPDKVILDYLVKTKTPQLVVVESTRSQADYSHLVRRFERAEAIRQSGDFTPAPVDAWWCTKDWCGYHASCPFARRPVVVSMPDIAIGEPGTTVPQESEDIAA